MTLTSIVCASSAPVGRGQRADRAEQPGVVHPQVDAPEPVDHGVGEARHGVAVGDVDGGAAPAARRSRRGRRAPSAACGRPAWAGGVRTGRDACPTRRSGPPARRRAPGWRRSRRATRTGRRAGSCAAAHRLGRRRTACAARTSASNGRWSQLLGVPLHGEDEASAGELDRLDDAVGRRGVTGPGRVRAPRSPGGASTGPTGRAPKTSAGGSPGTVSTSTSPNT